LLGLLPASKSAKVILMAAHVCYAEGLDLNNMWHLVATKLRCHQIIFQSVPPPTQPPQIGGYKDAACKNTQENISSIKVHIQL
jgi:hypothetical protein